MTPLRLHSISCCFYVTAPACQCCRPAAVFNFLAQKIIPQQVDEWAKKEFIYIYILIKLDSDSDIHL